MPTPEYLEIVKVVRRKQAMGLIPALPPFPTRDQYTRKPPEHPITREV